MKKKKEGEHFTCWLVWGAITLTFILPTHLKNYFVIRNNFNLFTQVIGQIWLKHENPSQITMTEA